jgi:hypothetical protein
VAVTGFLFILALGHSTEDIQKEKGWALEPAATKAKNTTNSKAPV